VKEKKPMDWQSVVGLEPELGSLAADVESGERALPGELPNVYGERMRPR
jgi:hypothetical protein